MKSFFFLPLLQTKHLRLQPTPLTTVCIFIRFPLSTFPFWSSVPWLISPTASPLSYESNGSLAAGWRLKPTCKRNSRLKRKFLSRIWGKQPCKKLNLFFFSNNNLKVPVLRILRARTETGVHVESLEEELCPCGAVASYREKRLFVIPQPQSLKWSRGAVLK